MDLGGVAGARGSEVGADASAWGEGWRGVDFGHLREAWMGERMGAARRLGAPAARQARAASVAAAERALVTTAGGVERDGVLRQRVLREDVRGDALVGLGRARVEDDEEEIETREERVGHADVLHRRHLEREGVRAGVQAGVEAGGRRV